MLMRCLLVSTTADVPESQHPLVPLRAPNEYASAENANQEAVAEEAKDGDRASTRAKFWFRQCGVLLSIAFLVPTITGSIYGAWYTKGEKDQNKAKTLQQLRYANPYLDGPRLSLSLRCSDILVARLPSSFSLASSSCPSFGHTPSANYTSSRHIWLRPWLC